MIKLVFILFHVLCALALVSYLVAKRVERLDTGHPFRVWWERNVCALDDLEERDSAD